MATFSISDLMQSMGMNAMVPSTSHSENTEKGKARVGHTRGRSIPETKELIKQAIIAAGRPISVKEACEALGRKQTPHLRGILHQMGDSGELLESIDIAPSKMMTRFWYSLPGR